VNQFEPDISCIYSGRELVYQGIKKCISLSLKSRILQIQLCLIHRGFRKKRTDFNFPIVNFAFMCSNIPTAPANRICTFPFIRYPTVCGSYHDILDIGLLLARKLLRTQAVNRITEILQLLNNVFINKTKILFPQAYVTLAEFGYPVLVLLFY
jgi:hypothetical protein